MLLPELEGIVIPKFWTVDFEKGLFGAISMVWPEVQLIGCYFHWVKCLKKRMKTEGIELNDDPFLNNFKQLCWVDPAKIPILIDLFTKETTDPKKIKFLDYFKQTWIKDFPISMWNVWHLTDLVLLHRTNCGMEAYNRQIFLRFNSKGRPGILPFITQLSNEEHYINMRWDQERLQTTEAKVRYQRFVQAWQSGPTRLNPDSIPLPEGRLSEELWRNLRDNSVIVRLISKQGEKTVQTPHITVITQSEGTYKPTQAKRGRK
jgi:hypothetical protein